MSRLTQSLATESGTTSAIVNVSRRRFLQHASVGALVPAVGLPSTAFAQEKKYGADAMPHSLRMRFSASGSRGIPHAMLQYQRMGRRIGNRRPSSPFERYFNTVLACAALMSASASTSSKNRSLTSSSAAFSTAFTKP